MPPLSDSELAQLSAHDGLRLLDEGAISAAAWVEALLAAMADARPLNAFLTECAETARAEASASDQRRAQGEARALEGLPLAVKDLFCTQGIRTTAGSRFLENYNPPYESTTTARLRDAGTVLLGKTNLDEFAMGSSTENSAFGAVKNPWPDAAGALTLVPGGSSGGSAAAVAARLAPVALGTDTGGSVRQPAAFCGIVGFKPTYGRLSRFGVIAFASSLDQPGLFARTVADLPPLFAVAAGFDPRDSTSANKPVPACAPPRSDLKGVRIGIPREYHTDSIDGEVAAARDAGAARLRELGAEVREVSLPHTDAALAAYYVIAPAEASSNLARYDGLRFGNRAPGPHRDLDAMYEASRAQGFGDEVKRRILIGTYVLSAGYYDAYYNTARKVRALVARDFEAVFRDTDLLLVPAAPTTAFPLGALNADPAQMYLQDVFTVPASLAGLPALTLPCGLSTSGAPLGLQLIAPAFEESKLFAAAACFERALGFDAAPPKVMP